MIPYFPQPEYHLFGPFTVHAFGAIVTVAVIVGWRMIVARTRAKNLDPDRWVDLMMRYEGLQTVGIGGIAATAAFGITRWIR